jgi:VIT1/CCC1 family predicted Fe2+/Mn2+ transporter
MAKARKHAEAHVLDRIGWLRAAVLGANDGVISTASLMIGVAAAARSPKEVMVAGVAGLIAGAMSMAAGEFVSVSSQADTEKAELAREKEELRTDPEAEVRELAGIYEKRGLDRALALQVAEELTKADALGAHARDELGITDISIARPMLAAGASASSFACGAILPIVAALISPPSMATWVISAGSLASLAILGVLGARAGGAGVGIATARVIIGGGLAMAITAGIGRLVGRVI